MTYDHGTSRPPALLPPARIGIAAPASAPLDPDALDRGIAVLRSRGFDVVHEPPVEAPVGYLAAPDAVRAESLNRLLRRDDIHAIVCARGGYGTLRLLDRLDYGAARRHPKLLVGYSDITALQLALYRHAGWTSISGPMAAVEWPDPDPWSERRFLELARGVVPSPLDNPDGSPLQVLTPGHAEGVLLGGNLTMIVRLVGTPYLPSLDGAVLFFEDVGEPPYRVDALLAQLHLAGHLDRLAGVVVGGFTEADPPAGRPSLTLEQVLRDRFAGSAYPVATGLRYGHFPVKTSVPIGVRARLAADDGQAFLHLLEPVVAGGEGTP